MLDELIPTDRETSREVSIDAVRALMAGTKNPRFEIECRSFINGFEPGDQVVEFCSAQNQYGLVGLQPDSRRRTRRSAPDEDQLSAPRSPTPEVARLDHT
ncbi:MAG: hypothetical protein ABIR54_20960 [Burkholderiaceae bacterium]